MAASGGLGPLPLLLVLLVRPGQPAALYPAAGQLQLPQLYRQLDGVLDSMVSGGHRQLPYGAAPPRLRSDSRLHRPLMSVTARRRMDRGTAATPVAF